MEQQLKYKRLKQSVFIGIIGVLFVPMIQHKFRFWEEKPLNGSYELSSKPLLNKKNWFSGAYQEGQDKYIREHTGFRPTWVRLYNQWNYSLFKKASAFGVVIGKENYLYEENYIKTYYGMDFLGEQKIEKITRQWKSIQDTLRKKGIDLVVVFAPGKGSFYPEYIPEIYKRPRTGETNYEVFKEQFKKHAVTHIDMHSWFESMKKTSKHPLFPKTGIHWSIYGQFLAVDSMSKFVSKRCNHEIPHLILDRLDRPDSTLLDDDDIEKGLNIFEDIPDLKLAYPKFHPSREKKKNDPKVLVIADSFYWGIFNFNTTNYLFNGGEFWYYNEQIYPATFKKESLVKNQQLDKKLHENKMVILLITDANLHKFGFGFVEMACKEYGIK